MNFTRGIKVRIKFSRFLVFVLTITLIGGTTVGAAGAQNKQSIDDSLKALSRVSAFAGSGEFNDFDGAAPEASFRMPQGIAVLKDGSVLVADTRNHLIRQVKNGEVSTYAGFKYDVKDNLTPEGAWHDGAKETAVFNGPSGMDTDIHGNIYIADTENHRIRKISNDGLVTTVAGDGIIGEGNGTGTGARFYHPQDVAVAADGTLYVADTLNHLIRQIAPNGQVTTLNAPSDRVVEVEAGYVIPAGDYEDGQLSASKFNEPTSIAIDHKGNLYVSDTGNQVIRYIDLAKGTVTTAAGLSPGEKPVYAKGSLYAEGGYADGDATRARFQSPRGIAVTKERGLIIADSLNHTIRYLADGHVSTIAGVAAQFGQVDGINENNLLHSPTDVVVLPSGGLLIADSYNNKIRELEYYKLPADLPRNNQVKVVMDESVVSFDAQPEIVKGHTMLPMRALSEMMDYRVGFLDNQRTIELTKGEVRIRLQMGSPEILIRDTMADAEQKRVMEAAPYAKDGRSYVPVRFFSEAFGVDVQWDSNTRTVILREITETIDKLPAADQNSRAAVIEQIKGKVWVTQAGGALTYQAYNGMNLHQGDHILTEKNTSAVLRTADRKDEITISENSELYISNLSGTFRTKHTSFMLCRGLASVEVSSLVNAKDTFNILTPTGVTDVRGTNFMVSIDPVTGIPSLSVSSGLVQASGNGTSPNPVFVYPAQEINLLPNLGSSSMPSMVDLSSLVNQFSPAIMEALLRQKNKIDQENAEMLEKMKNEAVGSNLGGSLGSLSPSDLEQYQNNLNNLLGNILKQALDQKKMDPKQLQTLIDEANKKLDHPIDLSKVPPLQLTPEQKLQQEKQKQLEAEQRKRLEEMNKQRELDEQKKALLDRIKADKERLEQENKKKQEEYAKRAEELYKQRLSDADKQKFEEQQKALELKNKQQQQAQQPKASIPAPAPTPNAPTAPTTPTTPTTPTNTAPKVIKPLPDRMVNADDAYEIDMSTVFHDVDGDALIFSAHSSDLAVAEVSVNGSGLRVTTKGKGISEIRITASDGKGGLTETSFRLAYYHKLEDLRAEVTSSFVELYWDAYGEEGTTYHVYMNDKLVESTPYTHVSLTGLKPDTVYNLRVVAIHGDDETEAFADYTVTTQPMDFQSMDVTANSITVFWGYYGGKTIKLYLNDEEIDPSIIGSSDENHYTFTDLSPNTSYNIRIEAWNEQTLWATSEITVETDMLPDL